MALCHELVVLVVDWWCILQGWEPRAKRYALVLVVLVVFSLYSSKTG